jgi:cytochrome c peroxidase
MTRVQLLGKTVVILLLSLITPFFPDQRGLAQEALPDGVPVPGNNPMTPGKIELGKKLFFDPRLSLSGNISCNSCHNVMAGGDDSRPLSLGFRAQLGGRNAPTVWNAAFQSVQFWDARATTLEEQAKGPMINSVEMAMPNHQQIIATRLAKIPGYVEEFKKVFGTKDGDPLTIDHVAKAIATYERTLVTRKSPFDRYIKGDAKAMSDLAIRGYETFRKVGCVSCHSGVNFSGPQLPLGTPFLQKFPLFADTSIEQKYGFLKDLGRAEVTKNESDKHLYRVPTLRNIAQTAPYFHNGKVSDLDEAIRIMGKVQLNKVLAKNEVLAIAAFLKEGLTGEFPAQTLPRLPQTSGTTLIGE